MTMVSVGGGATLNSENGARNSGFQNLATAHCAWDKRLIESLLASLSPILSEPTQPALGAPGRILKWRASVGDPLLPAYHYSLVGARGECSENNRGGGPRDNSTCTLYCMTLAEHGAPRFNSEANSGGQAKITTQPVDREVCFSMSRNNHQHGITFSSTSRAIAESMLPLQPQKSVSP
jgi:hypothetical protein